MKELFINSAQIILSVGVAAFVILFATVISGFVFNKFVDEISECNKNAEKEDKGGNDNDV